MYTIRPATQTDIPVISRLLVQLYAVELPGALKGPVDKQAEMFHFTFEANGEIALRHRYVVCDSNNTVVGTGMIQFPNEPEFERAPDGTISKALGILGFFNTLQLFITVARSLVGVQKNRNPESATIHSVVTDGSQRGKGVGALLMTHLESQIRARGLKYSVLQVIEKNVEAIPFYTKLGYQKTLQSPWWVSLLAWSSFMMEKQL